MMEICKIQAYAKRIPAFLTGFLLLTVFGIQQSSAQYCVPDYYTGTGSEITAMV